MTLQESSIRELQAFEPERRSYQDVEYANETYRVLLQYKLNLSPEIARDLAPKIRSAVAWPEKFTKLNAETQQNIKDTFQQVSIAYVGAREQFTAEQTVGLHHSFRFFEEIHGFQALEPDFEAYGKERSFHAPKPFYEELTPDRLDNLHIHGFLESENCLQKIGKRVDLVVTANVLNSPELHGERYEIAGASALITKKDGLVMHCNTAGGGRPPSKAYAAVLEQTILESLNLPEARGHLWNDATIYGEDASSEGLAILRQNVELARNPLVKREKPTPLAEARQNALVAWLSNLLGFGKK